MKRIVVDTNVLVSAVLLPSSQPGAILLAIRNGRFTPLYCEETLEELARVLARPRIRAKYRIGHSDIQTVLDLIMLRGQSTDLTERVTVCRDPKDDIFLSLALAGKADTIVSGDYDLLALHPFRGIPIMTPGDFVRAIAWAN